MKALLLSSIVLSSVVLPETRFINILTFVGDARLVALGLDGEGALDGQSYLFNPWRLPSYKNLEVSYSLRPVNWRPGEGQNYSYLYGVVSIDSSESVSFYFYQNNLGEQVAIAKDEQTFYGNVEPYQYLYAFVYRKEIVPSLTFGIALKRYVASGNPFFVAVPGVDLFARITGSATLGDFGVMYRRDVPTDSSTIGSLSFASSITNLGSWIVYSKEIAYQMPRSLHLGATYEVKFVHDNLLRPSSLLLTANYRNVLNAHDPDNHIYSGFGGELGFADAVFLRLGFQMSPFSSIFGDSDTPLVATGFGVQLPLAKVGRMLSSFTLKFDYAVVPVYANQFGSFITRDVSTNSIYTLRIGYRLSGDQ